ncbi:11634_t:CDS:2, partial [Acaulospora colombiana]
GESSQVGAELGPSKLEHDVKVELPVPSLWPFFRFERSDEVTQKEKGTRLLHLRPIELGLVVPKYKCWSSCGLLSPGTLSMFLCGFGKSSKSEGLLEVGVDHVFTCIVCRVGWV